MWKRKKFWEKSMRISSLDNGYRKRGIKKKCNMLLTVIFLAGLFLPGCTAGSGDSLSTRVVSSSAMEAEGKEEPETFRYVSRDLY
jgi:hypothetical protein